MKYLVHLFLSLCFFNLVIGGSSLKYYSTHIVVPQQWGNEESVTDYVSLANDPKSNLPKDFTICSSVFIHVVTVSESIVFNMLKDDGSPWFLLEISLRSRDYENLSEKMRLFLENPVTSKLESYWFTDTIIPIVPNAWCHICMGLDTLSGQLRIVVNGRVVVNEEKEYFRNTNSWLSRSLKNKLLVFKGYWTGFWYQYRSAFSNMNVFSSMMSVQDMADRTSGGVTCYSPGDYLRYRTLRMIIIDNLLIFCYIYYLLNE